MASFWGEIRRRKVFQVAVAYAIVGWILAQVADLTFPILLLPDWILRAFVIVLLLGFPLAVVLAWAFETTPEGIRRDDGLSAETPTDGKTILYIAGALVVGLALGGYFGRKAMSPPYIEPATVNPIQLTANPLARSVIGSAISPDGRYLAYAESDGLYLRLIESGESYPVAIPEGIELDYAQIDWFPSGTHILLSARIGNEAKLWKLAIVGGQPGPPLTDSAHFAAISADGNRIAYLPSRLSSEIWTIGADGEDPQRLVSLKTQGIWQLGWSPNGKFVIFGSGLSESQLLRAVEVATDDITVVMEDNRTFQNWRGYMPFVWAADGNMYYARTNLPPSNSMSNLWRVSIDIETARVDGPPVQLTNITGLNFRDISATADVSKIAFLLEENQADVYLSELADGGRRIERTQRLTYDQRNDYPTGWSADSNQLYFSSNRGASENVFEIELSTGNITARTGSLVDTDGNTELSPDGEWFMYWDAPEPDGSTNYLWRIPTAGGAAELVLEAESYSDFNCPHSLGPAAECIVGIRGADNQYAFHEFDPEYGLGRHLVSIDDNPPFTEWDLSPDARFVAVVHNSGPVRLINLETGSERPISKEGWIMGEFVAWTKDGNGLIMDGSSFSNLFRKALVYYDLDTGDAIEIRREPGQWHVRPKVSPDGSKVAYGLMIFSGNAWMIENP